MMIEYRLPICRAPEDIRELARGLAISKGLVELMGGRIWVESKPGKGSKFSFTIQAYASSKILQEETKPYSSSSFREHKTGAENLRILVAEDNPVNQRMTMLMLQKMGYKANAVANGKEVIEALERHPSDAILMDIEMPEIDGLEAARVVRRRWAPYGPMIIAVTAYALEGDRVRCPEAGMTDYLAKPVKLENLKDALERAKCELRILASFASNGSKNTPRSPSPIFLGLLDCHCCLFSYQLP